MRRSCLRRSHPLAGGQPRERREVAGQASEADCGPRGGGGGPQKAAHGLQGAPLLPARARTRTLTLPLLFMCARRPAAVEAGMLNSVSSRPPGALPCIALLAHTGAVCHSWPRYIPTPEGPWPWPLPGLPRPRPFRPIQKIRIADTCGQNSGGRQAAQGSSLRQGVSSLRTAANVVRASGVRCSAAWTALQLLQPAPVQPCILNPAGEDAGEHGAQAGGDGACRGRGGPWPAAAPRAH